MKALDGKNSASVSASVASRSSTVSPAPSEPVMLLEDAVGALEPVAGELVVDEHRNSGPEWQGASCPAGLGGRTPWCLVVYELIPGVCYGNHTTRVASGVHPQHNYTGIPDQWNRGRIRWQ